MDLKDPKTKKNMWIYAIAFCVVFIVALWLITSVGK